MYCNVLVTRPFDRHFTYKIQINQKITKGSVVLVPFGKKNDQIGLVSEIFEKTPNKSKKIDIKYIKFIFDNILIDNKILEFINWISHYTLAPKGSVLKLFLINYSIINHKVLLEKNNKILQSNVRLNLEQNKVFKKICAKLINKFYPIVLEGVTGSGKTEVYFEAIKKIYKQGYQSLIMLPEISLSPQLEERFKNRFGFSPHLWHSKVSEKNKKETWHKCLIGEPIVIIGARSSLFLPFKNLKLIIVDEEHDLSYKQDDNIRYHARDLAIVKAKIEKIPIILSSATPSLETYYNIQNKNFYHLFLSHQFSKVELPKIMIIDLKKEKMDRNQWISKTIIQSLKKCLLNKEQALLFLNRRGYAPLVLCQKCGFRYHCSQCSSWLVMHKNKNRLLCHHCGTIVSAESKCIKCNSPNSNKLIGPGVERLAEEVKSYFSNYSIKVMSSDNANTTNKIKKIITEFENKEIDILVATQIMAKGYHFPNLSLVGVIDADAGLMGGDIRAVERTYNLLQQVSGRAGRSKKVGEVYIQSYYPENQVIKSFKKRDRDNFIKQTLSERQKFNIPPYSSMCAIIVSGSSKSKVEKYANDLVALNLSENDVQIMGPVEAPIFLLRGKYRYRLLLKGSKQSVINKIVRNLIKNTPPPSQIKLVVDVNPYSFM